MNNPFDYRPDEACREAYAELLSVIESLRLSSDPADANLCRELDAGKMLGVLIAAEPNGKLHTLYAFSGQLADGGFHHPLFVGPVFDYLQPDGYFKRKEAEISDLNHAIDLFEQKTLPPLRQAYHLRKSEVDAEVNAYREKCRASKLAREAKRTAGLNDEAEAEAMIRQSQFEKAELRRRKKIAEAKLKPFADALTDAESRLAKMKETRHRESEALQQWLFSNFRVLNALGESKTLGEIFSDTTFKIPPSGAGECCAPKLLQAAYLRGLTPISMAEYWHGGPKQGEVRLHGAHYPACRGKCLPVLTWMLRGLDVVPPLDTDSDPTVLTTPEILFENQWFCVVNKPAGMLSVPGKGKAISVEEWLKQRFGSERQVKVAHRLDRDTSGLLIATFGELSFKVMQKLFAMRRVKKTYIADLVGDYKSLGVPRTGLICLPLSPDLLDRPRQHVDHKGGKEAVTDYEFIDTGAETSTAGTTSGISRIKFHPLTGRTHQLRVHAAAAEGLGMPIIGDPLYGDSSSEKADRLHLHALEIEFTFPIDRRHYSFISPLPF